MRNKLCLIICATFFIQSYQALGQHHHECKLHDIAKSEMGRHEARVGFSPNAQTSDYDITYHRLEWEVDPAIKYISGTVTTYFKPQTDNFSTIHFDFGDSMRVNRVRYRDQEIPYESIGNNTLAIDFPDVLAKGELDSVHVEYEGEPTNTGFSSFNSTLHNDVPILWTLSQPYGAKDWWPCKQNLNDKIDSLDVKVICPKGNKVATNGILKSVTDLEGEREEWFWQHRYPIPAYLIAIGVTNYEEFSQFVELQNGDSLEILNYVYPESRIQAESDLTFIIPMMELFNELFGEYPFAKEKYGHAQFDFGGGMEHQTMSFMGGYSFELQAHELAHQWFGDAVTCGSWQDIWINEGFATYLTGLAIERISPNFWEGWKAGNIARVVSAPGGSSYVEDTSSIGSLFSPRLTYSKGGLILHQLRWLMGDDLFFQACRALLNDPNHTFGYVNTDELRVVFEGVFGESLVEYFDDYVYGAGYPSFDLTWEKNGDELFFLLKQNTSDPSVDFFEMDVAVRVYTDGRDTTFRLSHEFNDQRFKYNFDQLVDSIVLDPDLWLISKDNQVREDFISNIIYPLDEVAKFWPVPIQDQFHIAVKKELFGCKAQFLDMNGKLVESVIIIDAETSINMRNWAKGAYWFRLDHAGKTYGQKLIKI